MELEEPGGRSGGGANELRSWLNQRHSLSAGWPTVPGAVSEAREAFCLLEELFSALQVSEHPEDDGHRRGEQQSGLREEQQHGGGARRGPDRSAFTPTPAGLRLLRSPD